LYRIAPHEAQKMACGSFEVAQDAQVHIDAGFYPERGFSSASRRRARALWRPDMTLPIGRPRASAISR
jgi:hypothetical protein